jgi:hypothetical protein
VDFVAASDRAVMRIMVDREIYSLVWVPRAGERGYILHRCKGFNPWSKKSQLKFDG